MTAPSRRMTQAEKERRYLACTHKQIVLFGSDETGLRDAKCEDCATPMTRRIQGDSWVWEPRLD